MTIIKKNIHFQILESKKCVSAKIIQHIYFAHKFTMFFIHRDMQVRMKNMG